MKVKKTLWIGFSSETKSGCYRVYEHDPHLAYAKPYHLHPGNDVKLKRENTAMRKWIIRENGGKRSVKKCPCLRCKKLREVVTDL